MKKLALVVSTLVSLVLPGHTSEPPADGPTTSAIDWD